MGSVVVCRSTNGYCSFLCEILATVMSKKQTVVFLSSAEAKIWALDKGISEGTWMKEILKDLGMMKDTCIRLYCDNNSAIEIACNPVQHDRTKLYT